MPRVSIKVRQWDRRGHGGGSRETDYEVLLHGAGKPVMLRRLSTHGDMTWGYWGSSAKRVAREYAGEVARVIGQRQPPVFWSEKPPGPPAPPEPVEDLHTNDCPHWDGQPCNCKG